MEPERIGEERPDERLDVEGIFNLGPPGHVLTPVSHRPTCNEGEQLVTVTMPNGDCYACWMKPKEESKDGTRAKRVQASGDRH